MKNTIGIFVLSSLVTAVVCGDMYYDPTGDIATGNSNLDITQVEVTDNGVDLFVSMTVADLNADWGNYLLFIDVFEDHGSGDNDNPWGRNISGLAGADFFSGSWVNDGGGNGFHVYDDVWSAPQPSGFSIDWTTSTITWSLNNFVADLSAWGIFDMNFEVATTGGSWGDPAIDLLGGEGGNWGEGSTGGWMNYEFSTVPAPSAIALLTLAGITRRRRH